MRKPVRPVKVLIHRGRKSWFKETGLVLLILKTFLILILPILDNKRNVFKFTRTSPVSLICLFLMRLKSSLMNKFNFKNKFSQYTIDTMWEKYFQQPSQRCVLHALYNTVAYCKCRWLYKNYSCSFSIKFTIAHESNKCLTLPSFRQYWQTSCLCLHHCVNVYSQTGSLHTHPPPHPLAVRQGSNFFSAAYN